MSGRLDPVLRPLLAGLLARPWRFAMGLHPLDPADWLVVTGDHAAETGEKRRLLDDGADIRRLLPEGEAAVAEMAVALTANLARYHAEIVPDAAIADPLCRLGLALQEDLCLMLPGPDGYRLVGAFVAFPARWRLDEKIGRPIGAIHAPVPGLESAIGRPIGLFFERLAAGRPVWRANWSISDDPTLFQPSGPLCRTATVLTADDAGERLWLRVERQTLTRLPVTGAVLFTILTFVLPLETLADEPALAAGLAARLGELPASMAAYKGLTANRDAIRRYLGEEPKAGP